MKKFFEENRTLFILIVVAIVCIIISVILLFKYFYFGNGGSNYGDRLEGIENVRISDEKQNEVSSKIDEDALVQSSTVGITGKRVDIRIVFEEKASLIDAQGIALKSLDNFSDEEKAFYDFHFTLKQEATEKTEGFLTMGAKNVNGSNLVWENHNSVSEEE